MHSHISPINSPTSKSSISMKLIITSLFIIIAMCVYSQRTTRKALEPKNNNTTAINKIYHIDSLAIEICGYDKTLYSNWESFFVKNNTQDTITILNITFDYFDSHKRQLHSATVSVDCNIPPKQTRQLSIKSWDKQNSFFYYRSIKPNRTATSYHVSYKINYICIR